MNPQTPQGVRDPALSLATIASKRAPAVRPHQTVKTMEDTDLQALMARLELLITRVEQLKSQNGLLLAQEKTWREERAHLIEKNEIARRKVESMISRLKALEQDS
ncbi:TIGR02449 family protein [Pseudomonas vancouverensis]|nr:TIGR02449 family protein [Pseudomonas vancouverensis]